MSDLWTVVWKEWRDSIFPGGKIEYLRPLVFITFLGIVLPFVDRQGWLALSGAMVFASVFFPYFYILNYIGDAFAGERERHTLETLLASRISDRAILLGKVIATVSYIWGMTVLASLLGLVIVNLAKGPGPWAFYTPVSGWAAVLVAGMLACLLAASGGILVSLHSATTRQAQQTLLLGSLALFVVIFFTARALPSQWFRGMSPSQIFLVALLVMALLDALLLGIAMASFRRSRLLLK
ncbi:MAG TPA: ABC transporter permease [Anaerolineales bacterium]|nr:ABC transporter permease [Anaerolineales bacterium]